MSKPKTDKPRKIVEMFEEGRRFTEELLEENKRLRLALEGHRIRNKGLEDAGTVELTTLKQRLHLLEEENLLVKQELRDVKNQFNEIEKENWDFSERYLHVERHNTSLLNLYVASQVLHSTLSFGKVIQIVKELVVNLVGSESFEVCLYDDETGELRVLGELGTGAQVGESLGVSETVKSALDSGKILIPGEAVAEQDGQSMIACVPLKLGGRVLGAIIIRELLAQKAGFEGIDHELFDLLGEHAVSAVCSSYLFTKSVSQGNSSDWGETMIEMSREASEIEANDLEPTVVW